LKGGDVISTRSIITASMLLIILVGAAPSVAAEAVRATFAGGDVLVQPLKENADLFTNRDYPLRGVPREMSGLRFTQRPGGKPASLTLDVSAGETVYLLADSDKSPNAVADLYERLKAGGWTYVADAEYIVAGKHPYMAIFKQRFDKAQQVTLEKPGWSGYIVAAKSLAASVEAPVKAAANANLRADPVPSAAPSAGPSTRPAREQTSITMLEVQTQSLGMMLGQTSELVLTITRSESPRATAVRFVTPIGDEMRTARDEALRYIRLQYPNWDVKDAEISFEDKYATHDGGSAGAAIATMVLSAIQGFEIDPTIAITGDISANGKIRAVGAMLAKLRGAIAGRCAAVAVPADNESQLADAAIYAGDEVLSDVQILGVATLDDAVAAVRVDRDPKLQEAIDLFATLQKSIKARPATLRSGETREALGKIIELAPQHLSAKLLLAVAEGRQPKTLSAGASQYFAFAAAAPMIDLIQQRAGSKELSRVPSAAIKAGLIELRKLRPMADANVRPLVDALIRFIDACDDVQSGKGSVENMQKQAQALLDEMARERADVKMMQKMLKEGV
jgi:hypothetical protein